MSTRIPGMDHAIYSYSPIVDRPPLRWPDRMPLAANIVIYLEYWELDPPSGSLRDPRYRDPIVDLFPSYRPYTWREYGNRIGIFRILDVIDRLKLPATVALNTAVCDRYPGLVDEMLRREFEIAAHAEYASRMISSEMSEAEERSLISASLNDLERLTGRRPVTWIGQDFGESTRTPFLLASAGIKYLLDWPNDDQPYLLETEPPIVSIPIQVEWDDVTALWSRRVLSPRYPSIVGEAFEALHKEGENSGRYFGLHIRPWLSGKPHRFPYLVQALERITAVENTWWTTAENVGAWVMKAARPTS